ncbi:hypothetical protein IAT38_006976 [Cryptococcus sp. DSM 104549]
MPPSRLPPSSSNSLPFGHDYTPSRPNGPSGPGGSGGAGGTGGTGDNSLETGELAWLDYAECAICRDSLMDGVSNGKHFWMTSCGHILCSAEEHEHRAGVCTACGKKMEHFLIQEGSLPPEHELWFQNGLSLLSGAMDELRAAMRRGTTACKVVNFQYREMKRSMQHHKEVARRSHDRIAELQRENEALSAENNELHIRYAELQVAQTQAERQSRAAVAPSHGPQLYAEQEMGYGQPPVGQGVYGQDGIGATYGQDWRPNPGQQQQQQYMPPPADPGLELPAKRRRLDIPDHHPRRFIPPTPISGQVPRESVPIQTNTGHFQRQFTPMMGNTPHPGLHQHQQGVGDARSQSVAAYRPGDAGRGGGEVGGRIGGPAIEQGHGQKQGPDVRTRLEAFRYDPNAVSTPHRPAPLQHPHLQQLKQQDRTHAEQPGRSASAVHAFRDSVFHADTGAGGPLRPQSTFLDRLKTNGNTSFRPGLPDTRPSGTPRTFPTTMPPSLPAREPTYPHAESSAQAQQRFAAERNHAATPALPQTGAARPAAGAAGATGGGARERFARPNAPEAGRFTLSRQGQRSGAGCLSKF